MRAKTYGVEVSATWQAANWWQLRGGYTFLKKRILLGDSQDLNRGRGEGNDPHHQFLIQSMINLPANLEFDSILRYVDISTSAVLWYRATRRWICDSAGGRRLTGNSPSSAKISWINGIQSSARRGRAKKYPAAFIVR